MGKWRHESNFYFSLTICIASDILQLSSVVKLFEHYTSATMCVAPSDLSILQLSIAMTATLVFSNWVSPAVATAKFCPIDRIEPCSKPRSMSHPTTFREVINHRRIWTADKNPVMSTWSLGWIQHYSYSISLEWIARSFPSLIDFPNNAPSLGG